MTQMMKSFLSKYSLNHYLLLVIMMVASILRFYDYFQLPYMHDELSAIIRLRFDTFADLINKGVVCDTHPPGLHVFLYYWASLFGTKAPIMKLPFIVMGIGSVYMIYWLGKNWFGASCGLLSAAFLASIQYFIFYSEIIRMYASGLFLCLLLLVFWTTIFVLKKDKSAFWEYVVYGVLLAACAYNHHFSALFAAIVFFFGFIYSNRNQWIAQLLSALLAAILYLPNVSIFISQLQQGGNGDWMSKPANRFIIDFMHYVFQFSLLAELLVASIIVGSLIFAIRNKQKDQQRFKLQFFALSLFAITYILAFIYSIKINPVLQYSGLIFSFPMLLLLAFSYSSHFSKPLTAILCVLLMSLNIFVLFGQRHHYEVMQKQPMFQSTQFLHEHPKYTKNALILFSENYKYYEWYRNDWGDKYAYISTKIHPLSYQQLDSLLQQSKADYFMAGNIPMDQMLLARQYFPCEEEKVYGFTNCFYVLSRKTALQNTSISSIQKVDTQVSGTLAEILYTTQVHLNANNYHARYDYAFETLNDSSLLYNTSILIEAKLNGNIIYNNDCPLRNYIKNNGDTSVKICLSERFEHIIKYYQLNKNLDITVSILQDKNHKVMRAKETFKIIADNNLVYSLYFPI
jgi:hypothetical protein